MRSAGMGLTWVIMSAMTVTRMQMMDAGQTAKLSMDMLAKTGRQRLRMIVLLSVEMAMSWSTMKSVMIRI